ncbi:MAG TPA: hypothetical protein VFC28_07660, partial [Opitutaceae bacterium]|nr:hypothetical protein [Opitutaceae bacterium]
HFIPPDSVIPPEVIGGTLACPLGRQSPGPAAPGAPATGITVVVAGSGGWTGNAARRIGRQLASWAVIWIEHDMSDGLAFASELPRHFGAARMLVQWIIPL